MRNSSRALSASLAALSFLVATPAIPQDDDTIEWMDNYQKALEESKRTHKPIFLEFRCEA